MNTVNTNTVNMNKSIFRVQHMRLNGQIFDHARNPVHPNLHRNLAGKYVIQKWREYVTRYASERGIGITTMVAHKVAYQVANRPFATCPLETLKSALLAEIAEALS